MSTVSYAGEQAQPSTPRHKFDRNEEVVPAVVQTISTANKFTPSSASPESVHAGSYDINWEDPNLIRAKYIDGYVVMPAAWWEDDDDDDEW